MNDLFSFGNLELHRNPRKILAERDVTRAFYTPGTPDNVAAGCTQGAGNFITYGCKSIGKIREEKNFVRK
jgi:hypothetical protein